MKFKTLLSVILLMAEITCAQNVTSPYASIDKLALQIPDSLTQTTDGIAAYVNSNFKSDTEKTRAIFVWVASNIQYDVENMFAINFYEKDAEKISKALRTRKGICENYATLFQEICTKSGIKSFVIIGYTQQDDFVDYIPHAWCGALVDSQYLLFDPTWGSGYVSNAKFYKKLNNRFFKTAPSSLIKSHMPFDKIWQFLNYPITNQQFYEGQIKEDRSRNFFNYPDSIATFERLDHIQQLKATARRIQENGVKNSLVFDQLQRIKLEIENEKQQRIVNLYNAAGLEYNKGVYSFNQFINYRNAQFKPAKPDSEIKGMLDSVEVKLDKAKICLNSIQDPDATVVPMVSTLEKAIDEIHKELQGQQDWLKLYLSKGKAARKSMFYKYTWFGIPLNK